MSPFHQITGRQLTYIITGSQVGTGMLVLPALLSRAAGHHAWMCVVLGACVALLNVLLVEKLGRRHIGLNIVQLFQALLGKVGGTVLIVIFAVYLLAYSSVLINAFGRLIQVFMLPRTPFWVIILLAMVCITYAASKGGQVVGRINETLFFGLVLSLIVLVIPVFYTGEFTNLLPLGELDARRLLQGTFYTLYTFAGTEILLVLYSQVDKPEQVRSAALRGVIVSMGAYLIVTVCCLLVFGAERMARYTWPGVAILKVAQVPVIERLEFYFLAIWIGIVLRRVINPTFAAALTMAQLFKIEERIKPFVLGMAGLVFAGSLLPPSVMALTVLWNYFGLLFLSVGFLIPGVLLTVSWLRKGEVSAHV